MGVSIPEEEVIAAPIVRLKTLDNTDVNGAKKKVSDLETFGDGDTFLFICKASSKAEGWMKSTKAMPVPGIGCVVQVTTQQGDRVAEALTFVPGAYIFERRDKDGAVIGRSLSGLDTVRQVPGSIVSRERKAG